MIGCMCRKCMATCSSQFENWQTKEKPTDCHLLFWQGLVWGPQCGTKFSTQSTVTHSAVTVFPCWFSVPPGGPSSRSVDACITCFRIIDRDEQKTAKIHMWRIKCEVQRTTFGSQRTIFVGSQKLCKNHRNPPVDSTSSEIHCGFCAFFFWKNDQKPAVD